MTLETDIMFVVSVPVLSVQMTVVQPKVSTEGRDRTIAFSRAILFVPRAKHLTFFMIMHKLAFVEKKNHEKRVNKIVRCDNSR